MAKKKKCPICGLELINPNSKSHINSKKHQAALEKQKVQRSLPMSSVESPASSSQSIPSSQFDNLYEKFAYLESKVEILERKINNLISPFRTIKIKEFKSQLINEYEHLNPLDDISGVDFEILRRRVCRELKISHDYFDDLIYDLQTRGHIFTIQVGRDKKYIQIKTKQWGKL